MENITTYYFYFLISMADFQKGSLIEQTGTTDNWDCLITLIVIENQNGNSQNITLYHSPQVVLFFPKMIQKG